MRRFSRFDERMTRRIHHLPGLFRPILGGIGFLGEPLVVLAIGAAGLVSAFSRHQDNAKKAFVLAGVFYALNILLKFRLRRRRPHNAQVSTMGMRSYSFPSGHAFGTVIVYGLFAYIDFNVLDHPWNLLLTAVLLAVIVLVGASRVYVGAHYPSDVVGGWAVGLVSLLIIILLSF